MKTKKEFNMTSHDNERGGDSPATPSTVSSLRCSRCLVLVIELMTQSIVLVTKPRS